MKAVGNGATIAESDDTLVVEGNHYFPADSVRDDFLRPSSKRTSCAAPQPPRSVAEWPSGREWR